METHDSSHNRLSPISEQIGTTYWNEIPALISQETKPRYCRRHSQDRGSFTRDDAAPKTDLLYRKKKCRRNSQNSTSNSSNRYEESIDESLPSVHFNNNATHCRRNSNAATSSEMMATGSQHSKQASTTPKSSKCSNISDAKPNIDFSFPNLPKIKLVPLSLGSLLKIDKSEHTIDNVSEDDSHQLNDAEIHVNNTTDDTLESTRRMMDMCEENQKLGVNVITYCEVNNEQINRINQGMIEINKNVKNAEHDMNEMEEERYCCGLMTRKSRHIPNIAQNVNNWITDGDGKSQSREMIAEKIMTTQPVHIDVDHVVRVTDDVREDEMEKNLCEVEDMVGNLKNMAIDIGFNLTSQNKKLEKINDRANRNEANLCEVNKQADKLLKE